MRRIALMLSLILLCVPVPAQPYKPKPGPCAVEAASLDWTDAARNREVPVKIYFPKDATEKSPLIIFSHGLGGSRDGYEYLGRHWASWGYISVHVQHKGSDTEVWKGAANREEVMKGMRDSLADVRNAVDRPRDVSFVIDQVTKLNADDDRFKGRIDLDRIGMAGHSFGAWTTLAVAGQGSAALDRMGMKFTDPRVKAAVAMSPGAGAKVNANEAYAAIRIPILHMTGTLDDSVINDSKAADRRVPFDHITGADQFLLTFEGGDHMVFSGRPRAMAGGDKDALFQGLILQSTTAFWHAYLKGDAKAKDWLARGAFEKTLGKDGKFETKQAAGR